MCVQNFILFDYSSVFYAYVCLFDVKLPEDDTNEIETYRGELYVKMCV
jgi:hypothetical protein